MSKNRKAAVSKSKIVIFLSMLFALFFFIKKNLQTVVVEKNTWYNIDSLVFEMEKTNFLIYHKLNDTCFIDFNRESILLENKKMIIDLKNISIKKLLTSKDSITYFAYLNEYNRIIKTFHLNENQITIYSTSEYNNVSYFKNVFDEKVESNLQIKSIIVDNTKDYTISPILNSFSTITINYYYETPLKNITPLNWYVTIKTNDSLVGFNKQHQNFPYFVNGTISKESSVTFAINLIDVINEQKNYDIIFRITDENDFLRYKAEKQIKFKIDTTNNE